MLELIIFSAIFAITAGSFFAILVAVTRVQVRQTGAAEVGTQSQHLLQTIQYYVGSSSLIELASDTPTTTLKLRMPQVANDPAYIYLSNGTIYLKLTDSGTPQALSSNKVTISNVTFTKRANVPAQDSVAVAFTVAYNTSNIQQQFTQTLGTSIARVNAATFDSNVIPSASNTYKIGASSQLWQSINDVLYFSGSNVGIGAAAPGQSLEVNGGMRLNTVTAQPTCDSTQRGTFWVTQSGGGTKDYVQVCVRNASSSYLWATIY